MMIIILVVLVEVLVAVLWFNKKNVIYQVKIKFLCGNNHQFINNIELIILLFLNDNSDQYSYRIKDNMLTQ